MTEPLISSIVLRHQECPLRTSGKYGNQVSYLLLEPKDRLLLSFPPSHDRYMDLLNAEFRSSGPPLTKVLLYCVCFFSPRVRFLLLKAPYLPELLSARAFLSFRCYGVILLPVSEFSFLVTFFPSASLCEGRASFPTDPILWIFFSD